MSHQYLEQLIQIDVSSATFEQKKIAVKKLDYEIGNLVSRDAEELKISKQIISYLKKYDGLEGENDEWVHTITDALISFWNFKDGEKFITKEEHFEILINLFTMKGIDMATMIAGFDQEISSNLLNPVQTLCSFYNEKSILMETVFSRNICVLESRVQLVIEGHESVRRDTIIYDRHFNEVVDKIFKEHPVIGLHRARRISIEAMHTIQIGDSLEWLNRVLSLPLLPEEPWSLRPGFDNIFGGDVEREEIGEIHSLSYTCVEYGNYNGFLYLIASGKDPKIFFRSKRNEHEVIESDPFEMRNSLEHCFSLMEVFQNPNLTKIKNLMLLYIESPAKAISFARKEVMWMNYSGAFVFACIIGFCDGYYTTNDANMKRFLSIAERLPFEIAMVLANRSQGSMSDFVSPPIFKSMFDSL